MVSGGGCRESSARKRRRSGSPSYVAIVVGQAPFLRFCSFDVGRSQTIAGSGPRRPLPGDDGRREIVIERNVFDRMSAVDGWMCGKDLRFICHYV